MQTFVFPGQVRHNVLVIIIAVCVPMHPHDVLCVGGQFFSTLNLLCAQMTFPYRFHVKTSRGLHAKQNEFKKHDALIIRFGIRIHLNVN